MPLAARWLRRCAIRCDRRRTDRPETQESTLNALSATASLLAAAGGGEEFHPPSIDEFFPPAVLFEGSPFELNRIMLIRLLAVVVLIVLFTMYARRSRIVPGRGTGTAELLLDFVRVQISELVLGERDGRRFLPLVATLFFAVFALNVTGVIPGLNIAGTSVIGLPIVFALIVYAVFVVVGFSAQGVGYLRSSLFPPGVPKPLYLLITPIEFISTFAVRPASLAIRLWANMLVGHLLLVLCFSATQYFLFDSGFPLGAFGVVTLLFGFAFTLFEAFVAALQAYIFALLAALYISTSLHAEH